MATTEVPFLLGVALLNQSTRGTPTSMAAIGGGAGTGGAVENLTDGAILGDPRSGVGESGISYSLGKKITEKAPITGSFSKSFANFVSVTVDGFTITVPLKGNGETTTATPIDSDFTPDIGIIALLRAAGLTGAGSGALWRFTPTAVGLVTAALYSGNESNNGLRVILKDCVAASAKFNFTPAEVATLEVTLGGVYVASDEGGSWPSTPFEYGNQQSLSAPAVTGVAFTWGPGTPAARSIGFSDLAIDIDLGAEIVPSSNATAGEVPRQTGRDIKITGTIDAAAAEVLYETAQLAESAIGNADPLSFTVGTPATGSDTANAIKITVPDPELVSLEKVDPLGNSEAWAVELTARTASANGEFQFDFL